MSRRKINQQSLALALAVPQVVAHRVGRIAQAGPTLSARDRREFTQMGAEKVAAFYESWAAMAAAGVRAQQSMGLAMMRNAALVPWGLARPASLMPSANTLAAHATRVMAQGLAPVHKRAVGNAKRLGRSGKRR